MQFPSLSRPGMAAAVVAIAWAPVLAAPTVIFQDDFESYSLGGVPSNSWTVSPNQNIAEGDPVFKTVNSSLDAALSGNATQFARVGRSDSQAVAYADLDPAATAGQLVEISLDIYVPSTATALWLYGSETAGALSTGRSFDVRFLGGKSNTGDLAGSVEYRDGGPLSLIEDIFSSDQWVNVSIVADYASATYDVLVNGSVVIDGAAFQHDSVTELGSVRFAGTSDSQVQGGSSEYVYFDNLTVTVIPEPASLALIGTGALLMLRRRRA